jgi:DNA-binding transcriptional ArsR family regulator
MELTQNIWERYGFRGNPFDTGALSATAESLLPISQAIVGREMESAESRALLGVLQSAGGGRAVVEGDIGVGKTTFVNYHRYLWEIEAKDKLLTTATEIALPSDVTLRDVLWNILGALVGKILLLRGESYVQSRPLLRELFLLNRVFFQRSLAVQASVFGFGGGVGRSAQVSVAEPTDVQLQTYLRDLVGEARELGFKGLFLHLDNLELMSLRNPERTRQLLEDLRDTLQTPNVYFVLVGQTGFFTEMISPSERVRSVFFGHPIHIPPLRKEQVLEAVNKRYRLLAAHPDRFIRPVTDELIEYLYDLYDGKMRFVMDAVSTVVTHLRVSPAQALDTTGAKTFLAGLVFERLRRELTAREWDVIREAVRLGTFTNADIAKSLKVKPPNVTKYLNTLLDRHFIYPHRREGRQIFYRASEDVRIIRDLPADVQRKLPLEGGQE